MTSKEELKQLLSTCIRYELRDHAFGDREVTWEDEKGIEVAAGYFSGSSAVVDYPGGGAHFLEDDAREFLSCGTLKVDRNDETGPDDYAEGNCMPGLTIEGVLRELTEGKGKQG